MGHYFRGIQRKKGYAFSIKPDHIFPKIAGVLRLKLSHNMIRLYRQCGRASIILRLRLCRHAIRYPIADAKIGKLSSILKNRWQSGVYNLSQILRISNESKLIFK
ncbi:hypothetical protein HMPREF1870_02411 [Bacteroidales bacterium KA00344]|nr:hypothetical protein HMPREF1870_02411 [Bacteroidales bacterium KA00344]